MAAHTYKYGDYIKGGLDLFKANLVPAAVAGIGSLIPVVGSSVLVNYLRGLKDAKGGKPLAIGDLFKLDNLIGNFIAHVVNMIGFCCCWVPGVFMIFTLPIMADKPTCQPINAAKGSFQFGLANAVGQIIMVLAFGFVGFCLMLPMIILQVVAGFIHPILQLVMILPILGWAGIIGSLVMAMAWTAYDDARSAVESSATAAGVTLT